MIAMANAPDLESVFVRRVGNRGIWISWRALCVNTVLIIDLSPCQLGGLAWPASPEIQGEMTDRLMVGMVPNSFETVYR